MTSKTQKFSLRPFYLEGLSKLMPVEFDIQTKDIFHPYNPVFQTLPQQEIDYGKLFTYAFRRFGLPNVGSDGYKDIARWFVTTPHPDLIFAIRPAPYPEPRFSLQFLVPEEIFWTCENWERQDLDAWIERKLDWVEAQGLPSWMPDFLKSYQEHQWPGATWRDSYRGYIAMFTPRESEFQLSITSKSKAEEEHRRLMTEFAAKVAEYEKIESRPGFRKRSPNIDQWTEDDPLKPFALAAIIALEDLKTGVRVRDSAINAFGVMPEMAPEEVVTEPESAGYAIGGLFNQAPRKCAELYKLAHKHGNGDVKEGLSKILQLATEVGIPTPQ